MYEQLNPELTPNFELKTKRASKNWFSVGTKSIANMPAKESSYAKTRVIFRPSFLNIIPETI